MKLTYDIDSVQKKIKNINILVFEYDIFFYQGKNCLCVKNMYICIYNRFPIYKCMI